MRSKLITPAEADSRIMESIELLSAVSCPLDKVAGRVLAEAIKADRDFPPYNRSMMDGYAVDFKRLNSEGIFKVEKTIYAGDPESRLADGAGAGVEIMTGAVVPEGANAVIPYEDTEKLSDRRVKIIELNELESGDYIHPKGSDAKAGSCLVPAGEIIGSREVGIAASVGLPSLSVSRLPSIGIMGTGDELIPVDQIPQAHQIRRSNDSAIEAGLARQNLYGKIHEPLPDDESQVKYHLGGLLEELDVVILSGGISMGKKDFVPKILQELGATCIFQGVSQKPGKPFGVWKKGKSLLFGLPGNPLSTLVCLHRYVIPALFYAMGLKNAFNFSELTVNTEIKSLPHLNRFVPVVFGRDSCSVKLPNTSGDFTTVIGTKGFVEIPPGFKTDMKDCKLPFIEWS